jgi:hypothetical protein
MSATVGPPPSIRLVGAPIDHIGLVVWYRLSSSYGIVKRHFYQVYCNGKMFSLVPFFFRFGHTKPIRALTITAKQPQIAKKRD